jgi:triacylglycerol esterase/lipase EstA (alpha/beta hydrolase family)
MTHLVIICGGLLGYPYLLTTFATLLLNALGSNNYVVHVSQVNTGLGTLNGIDHGGHRLVREIKQQCSDHNATELSVIGISLGGLYSKYAVKELSNNNGGLVKPKHFITLGTPHCGIPGQNYLKRTILNLLPTGQQLLFDHPVLSELLTNTTGLSKFESHTSVCSPHDQRVPYESCAMSVCDDIDVDWEVDTVSGDGGFMDGLLAHNYITMNNWFIDNNNNKWAQSILKKITNIIKQ